MQVFLKIGCMEHKGYSAASDYQTISLDNASPTAMRAPNNANKVQPALCAPALREGEENVPRINSNPDFDFIRDDPRFKALLKEMRLLD